MSVSIRPGTEEDIPATHACLDYVAKEGLWLARDRAPPLERSKEWWGALIRSGAPFLIVLDGGAVVGWCDIEPTQIASGVTIGILGMGLLPAYRGRKIGHELLAEACRSARIFGMKEIRLNVRISNVPARKLYTSMGFVPFEEGLANTRTPSTNETVHMRFQI